MPDVSSFLYAASERPIDTLKCDARVEPRVSYFVVMSLLIASFVGNIRVCAILAGSGYNKVTALIAGEGMRTTDWPADALEPIAKPLIFTMVSGTVSNFAVEGATRLARDEKESVLTQLRFLLSFLCVPSFCVLLCLGL